MGLVRRLRRFSRTRAASGLLLVSPTALFVILLLALPLLAIFTFSFWTQTGVVDIDTTLTLDNYREAFTEPLYARLMLRSVLISGAVTATTVLLAFPVAYFDYLRGTGGKWITHMAGQQRMRYGALHADPPDPAFTDFTAVDIGAINADLAALAPLVPLTPLEYPFVNLSQDPLHLVSARLANSMAEEAALVFALMRTLEKFQGAEDAADDEFTFLQARALKKYADQLAAQLAVTRQGTVDYKAELVADGLASFVFDGADLAALFARLTSTGLTVAEEQGLRDVGFTDGDIQVMFDRIAAFPAPTGTFSRGGGLDDVVTSIDMMSAAVQDLANQAQAVVDHYAPLVTVQHPSADAGGPYNGDEGTPVNFDGSGSFDPQAQALIYEWDFDLDGQFDDAVGIAVNNTYGAPGATQVGLRVTDTDGNVDVAYATVAIADVNGPPQITSFTPVDLAPTASNLNPLDFSATATDPDFEVVGFEWLLDGTVMSTASGWTYTPGISETGTRLVRLTVSDFNPLSEDAIEMRLVHLPEPQSWMTASAGIGLLGALYRRRVRLSRVH